MWRYERVLDTIHVTKLEYSHVHATIGEQTDEQTLRIVALIKQLIIKFDDDNMLATTLRLVQNWYFQLYSGFFHDSRVVILDKRPIHSFEGYFRPPAPDHAVNHWRLIIIQ